jgi:hypothetical protein
MQQSKEKLFDQITQKLADKIDQRIGEIEDYLSPDEIDKELRERVMKTLMPLFSKEP